MAHEGEDHGAPAQLVCGNVAQRPGVVTKGASGGGGYWPAPDSSLPAEETGDSDRGESE